MDNYSPIYQNDTLIPFAPQFTGLPNGLNGITISMKMVNESDPLDIVTCSGTWTIDDAANAKAHYVYAPSDVATPGMWTLYIKLTETSTGAFVQATKPLEILPAP